MRFIVGLLLALLFSCAHQPSTDSRSLQFVPVHDLRVTQSSVGMAAVWERVQRLEYEDRRGRLRIYLQRRVAPAVLGPYGEIFIIDRHHLSRALQLAVINPNDRGVYIEIIEDLSSFSEQEFWKKMIERDWVLLTDRGEQISPSQLPRGVRDLQDDPYRSLARYAQRAGRFEKTTEPFLEFRFAENYREKLRIPDDQMPTSVKGLRQLIPQL